MSTPLTVEFPKVASFWKSLTLPQRVMIFTLHQVQIVGSLVKAGHEGYARKSLEVAEVVSQENCLGLDHGFCYDLEGFLTKNSGATALQIVVQLHQGRGFLEK